MQSSIDHTPLWRGDAPLYHVVSHSIHPVVDKVVSSMQSSNDPTLLLESVDSTKVVMSIKYLVDPTLLLENVESTTLVTPMQYLADPTFLMGSNVSIDYVFNISN
jgi:hypothetical protein